MDLVSHNPLQGENEAPPVAGGADIAVCVRPAVDAAGEFFEPAALLILQDRFAVDAAAHEPGRVGDIAGRQVVKQGL